MIADINKVAEYSSKIGSFSHEAKVNKWLAEQSAMSEQLSAEYLNAPRRRRPRVDPSLLDWKKLTGEENVAVINRLTGKKVRFRIYSNYRFLYVDSKIILQNVFLSRMNKLD